MEFKGENVLQYATWGPVGASVVFVMHNNIYIRPNVLEDKTEAITTDGLLGHIYNGIPDWVYEGKIKFIRKNCFLRFSFFSEEVFSSNKAVWFSPDGKKLAYAKFNDTLTPVMTIPIYGQPGSLEFQYPRAVQIRYPKVKKTLLTQQETLNFFSSARYTQPNSFITRSRLAQTYHHQTRTTRKFSQPVSVCKTKCQSQIYIFLNF